MNFNFNLAATRKHHALATDWLMALADAAHVYILHNKLPET